MASTSEKVLLVSTADTGFCYITRNMRINNKGKLKLRKYDPIARKHVDFVEKKISKAKK